MDGMKVMFIASLYEKEDRQFNYLAIIELLESLGHSILHTHITNFTIEQISNSQAINARFHKKIFKKLKTVDLIVADVTRQSVGVGFTIAQALQASKPVLALTAAEVPPITHFLEESELLMVHHYKSIRELEIELPFLLSQVEPKKDKKFNMFLSPDLDDYLLAAAGKKRVSKAEYIRQLLEKDRQ